MVGPDGAQVDTDENSALRAKFDGTLFEAVLDASQGVAWPRESGGEPPDRWWSTHGRLRIEILAMLRILTNFDMDSRLVLSIVLAGQPKLRETLRRAELDDVAKRLAHFSTLRPLSRDETQAYIEHRCAIAGSAALPFDDGALDAIFEIGRGNVRATDQLARKSLGIAHESDADACCAAYVAQARKVLWP